MGSLTRTSTWGRPCSSSTFPGTTCTRAPKPALHACVCTCSHHCLQQQERGQAAAKLLGACRLLSIHALTGVMSGAVDSTIQLTAACAQQACVTQAHE